MYLRWFGGVAGQKGPSKKQPNKISIVAYSLVTHLRLAGCSSPQPPPTTCLLPPLLDLGRAERLLTPKHEPRKKSLNLLVLSALPGPDESLPKPMSTVTNAHLLTLSFDLGGAVRLSVSKHKSRKKSLNLLVLSAPSGPDDSLPKPMSNFTNACIANYRLTYLTLTLMLSSWILKNQPWKKVTQAPSSLGVGPKAPVQINAVSLFGTKVSIAKKFTQPPGCPEVGQKLLKPRSKVTESHVANNRLFGLTPVRLVLKHESRKSLPEHRLTHSDSLTSHATTSHSSTQKQTTKLSTLSYYLTICIVTNLCMSPKLRSPLKSQSRKLRKHKTGTWGVYNSIYQAQKHCDIERHWRAIIVCKHRRSNDVESNPGPNVTEPETKLTLITQNCRGLGEEKKCKHLLNNCYKIGRSTPNFVIALQETMVTDDKRLRFGWRGNHIFTPGTGHGRGCLTLLPSHIQADPDTVTHFEQRGHIFKAQINQNSAVIANVYSPTGLTREKIDFFKRIKLEIENLRDPLDDVYLMGDLNTVFEAYETHYRSYSNQEQRHSAQIKQVIDSLALEDIWRDERTSHTWRQPGTKKSSRLDRIYYQHNLIKKGLRVDWAFTNSDHGAVIAQFTDGKINRAHKPLRLHPELLNSKNNLDEFVKEYREQIQQIPDHWNAHQALEFHKCAMRNAYIKVSSESKRRDKRDYDFIKEDLHSHIAALESCNDQARSNRLMNRINQLKATITKMNLDKGTSLANKLKTKWYNEGERSNKYFLRTSVEKRTKWSAHRTHY